MRTDPTGMYSCSDKACCAKLGSDKTEECNKQVETPLIGGEVDCIVVGLGIGAGFWIGTGNALVGAATCGAGFVFCYFVFGGVFTKLFSKAGCGDIGKKVREECERQL